MIPTKAGIYKFCKLDGTEKTVEIRTISFFMGDTHYTLRTAGEVGSKMCHNLDYAGSHEYSDGVWYRQGEVDD